MNRTMEQKRAEYAMDKVKKHGFTEDKNIKKYATLIRKLPSMVMQNGLGQSMAYLLADAENNADAKNNKEKPSRKLYFCIGEWICKERKIYSSPPEGLMQALMVGDKTTYLHAQQEALALLAWMRKFADAYLPKGES